MVRWFHCIVFRRLFLPSYNAMRSSLLLRMPQESLHSLFFIFNLDYSDDSFVSYGLAEVSLLHLDVLLRWPLGLFGTAICFLSLARLVRVMFFLAAGTGCVCLPSVSHRSLPLCELTLGRFMVRIDYCSLAFAGFLFFTKVSAHLFGSCGRCPINCFCIQNSLFVDGHRMQLHNINSIRLICPKRHLVVCPLILSFRVVLVHGGWWSNKKILTCLLQRPGTFA